MSITYYHLRNTLRLQWRVFDNFPLAQVHTSSNSPSRPPRSSHEGLWSGFSVAMNLRTSFTVTKPDKTPWSSTRMVRGLHCLRIRQITCVVNKRGAHPIRLNICITISKGTSGDTVIGVWRYISHAKDIKNIQLTLLTHGQNCIPSPAVVGAKYSSGSSSSCTGGARSISSTPWCLAVKRHGVLAKRPRFLRARSDITRTLAHGLVQW